MAHLDLSMLIGRVVLTVLWVDVSHHDWSRRGGNLDWPRVRAVTSEVMMARATYGDPSGFNPSTRHFAAFQRGASAAGFTLRGGYHNLIRGDAASMRRQVGYFRGQLDAHGCHWAMLDIERYQELVSNDLWPRFADVLRFRDAWHAVESRPLAYYLPRWLHNGYYGGADLRQLPGPLIQSHYAGGTAGSAARIYANAGGDRGTGWDDSYGNRLPDIWQFTADADVDGASSVTDANAYRGTLDQLRILLTGDDVAINETDFNALIWRVEAIISNRSQVAGGPLAGEVNRLAARLAELSSPTLTDEQLVKLADLIAARLPRPSVPPTPQEIARAVLDEDHRRSAE